MYYLSFSNWLISLSIMFFRSITKENISFFLQPCSIPLCAWPTALRPLLCWQSLGLLPDLRVVVWGQRFDCSGVRSGKPDCIRSFKEERVETAGTAGGKERQWHEVTTGPGASCHLLHSHSLCCHCSKEATAPLPYARNEDYFKAGEDKYFLISTVFSCRKAK